MNPGKTKTGCPSPRGAKRRAGRLCHSSPSSKMALPSRASKVLEGGCRWGRSAILVMRDPAATQQTCGYGNGRPRASQAKLLVDAAGWPCVSAGTLAPGRRGVPALQVSDFSGSPIRIPSANSPFCWHGHGSQGVPREKFGRLRAGTLYKRLPVDERGLRKVSTDRPVVYKILTRQCGSWAYRLRSTLVQRAQTRARSCFRASALRGRSCTRTDKETEK